MTNQEAIDTIKTAIAQVEWDYPMDYAAAFDMAVKVLEEEPKWYGLYILFNPDTPEEEIDKAIMQNAAETLAQIGALKIIKKMDPEPHEDTDGTMKFYRVGGWKIQLPGKNGTEQPKEEYDDAE